MNKETLKEEIERIWGPYSEHARFFRSLMREHDEIEKRANQPGPSLTQKKEERNLPSASTAPSDVVKTVETATLTYFFTRAFFIIGTWVAFGIITIGTAAVIIFLYA